VDRRQALYPSGVDVSVKRWNRGIIAASRFGVIGLIVLVFLFVVALDASIDLDVRGGDGLLVGRLVGLEVLNLRSHQVIGDERLVLQLGSGDGGRRVRLQPLGDTGSLVCVAIASQHRVLLHLRRTR
jgi:DNA helicase HerA-like ATPase